MNAQTGRRLVQRLMRLDDLDAVLALEQAAHRNPWSVELIRRELDHEWSTVLLGLEQGAATGSEPVEHLAGYVIFWVVHDEIHILNLAVAPDFRRRGYARALLCEAEARGRSRGAVLSTLEVRRSNEAALSLYRAMGYRQVGLRLKYYADDNEDAIVMLKDLSATPGN